jgi:hypothetical protein
MQNYGMFCNHKERVPYEAGNVDCILSLDKLGAAGISCAS